MSSGELSGASGTALPTGRSSWRAPPSRSGSRSQVRRTPGSRAALAVGRDPRGPLGVPVPGAAGGHVQNVRERRQPPLGLRRLAAARAAQHAACGAAGRAPRGTRRPAATCRPVQRARPPPPASRCSSGPGGTSWSRWTPSTSVAASTAPLARNRASASGRPSTSSRTMSYGPEPRPRPSPSASPAGAAPGGSTAAARPPGRRPRNRYPVGPRRRPAPGARPAAPAPGRAATRPGCGSPAGTSIAGPSCGCESSTCTAGSANARRARRRTRGPGSGPEAAPRR
ncbi:hypothetical protein SRIMM317S_02204 [Streptomyces rimosus subsp. rimosus]